jgi:hypothetical protein
MAVGRDSRGLFQAGNQFGKDGGYQRHRDAQWRREVVECVTQEDRLKVLKAMIEAAQGGDVSACKLLWSYWYGKPTMTIDLSVTDERPRVIILPDNGTSRERRRAIEAHVPGGPVPDGTGHPADEGG